MSSLGFNPAAAIAAPQMTHAAPSSGDGLAAQLAAALGLNPADVAGALDRVAPTALPGWSFAEVETLCCRYPHAGAPGAAADLPGRTVGQCRDAAFRLGLRLTPAARKAAAVKGAKALAAIRRPSWSDDEIARLRDLYSSHGAKGVARVLGRGREDVKAKAKELELVRREVAPDVGLLDAVKAAAEAGAPCPTNADLAAAAGYKHGINASRLVRSLAAAGRLVVDTRPDQARRMALPGGAFTAWSRSAAEAGAAAAASPASPRVVDTTAATAARQAKAAARRQAFGAKMLAAIVDAVGLGGAAPSNADLARIAGCSTDPVGAILGGFIAAGDLRLEVQVDGARRFVLRDGRATAWRLPAGRRPAPPPVPAMPAPERAAAAVTSAFVREHARHGAPAEVVEAVKARAHEIHADVLRLAALPRLARTAEASADLVAAFLARGGQVGRLPPAYCAPVQGADLGRGR